MATPFEDFVNGEIPKRPWLPVPGSGTLPIGQYLKAKGVGMELETASAIALGNTRTVASSGGEFTSIQLAIDSITDATSTNVYVVLIYPGVYAELLTLPGNIYLQGVVTGSQVAEIKTSLGTLLTCPNEARTIVSNLKLTLDNPTGTSAICHIGDNANNLGSVTFKNCDIIQVGFFNAYTMFTVTSSVYIQGSYSFYNCTVGMLKIFAGGDLIMFNCPGHIDINVFQDSYFICRNSNTANLINMFRLYDGALYIKDSEVNLGHNVTANANIKMVIQEVNVNGSKLPTVDITNSTVMLGDTPTLDLGVAILAETSNHLESITVTIINSHINFDNITTKTLLVGKATDSFTSATSIISEDATVTGTSLVTITGETCEGGFIATNEVGVSGTEIVDNGVNTITKTFTGGLLTSVVTTATSGTIVQSWTGV